MTGMTEKSFELLAGLEADNTKDWFDAHRADMRDIVQGPFADILQAVTERLADGPLPLKGGEHTMFRMNRDVRFSKDKSPYRAQVSGVLTGGGTKNEDDGLIYLQMDAHGGFIACGFYNLAPKDLAPIRDRIVAKPDEFDNVVEHLDKAGYALSRDGALSGMPHGYAQHAEAPFAEHLKLKSMVVKSEVSKKDWMSGDVIDEAVKLARACARLIAFGRAAR